MWRMKNLQAGIWEWQRLHIVQGSGCFYGSLMLLVLSRAMLDLDEMGKCRGNTFLVRCEVTMDHGSRRLVVVEGVVLFEE